MGEADEVVGHKFQFHYGSIKGAKYEVTREQSDKISIPLWFD